MVYYSQGKGDTNEKVNPENLKKYNKLCRKSHFIVAFFYYLWYSWLCIYMSRTRRRILWEYCWMEWAETMRLMQFVRVQFLPQMKSSMKYSPSSAQRAHLNSGKDTKDNGINTINDKTKRNGIKYPHFGVFQIISRNIRNPCWIHCCTGVKMHRFLAFPGPNSDAKESTSAHETRKNDHNDS